MPILQVINRVVGGGPSGSGPFFNIYHFNVATADSAAANAIIPVLKTYCTAVAALQDTSTTTTIGWKAVNITADPPLLVGTTAQSVVGTTGGGNAPAQLCLVTSWRTAVATRSGRGRTYHGPMSLGGLTTSGLWVTTLTTAIQTAANAMLPALLALAGATSLVVYHRANDAIPALGNPGQPGYRPAKPATVASWQNVISAISTTTPYTQRRRAL